MINATVIIDPSHRNQARPITTPSDGSVVFLINWFILSTHLRRPALLWIQHLHRAVLALHHRQQPSSNHARRLVPVLRHVSWFLFTYPSVAVAAVSAGVAGAPCRCSAVAPAAADADAAAALYDDVITGSLNEILPTRVIVRRPRPTDPWFDGDCRAAKRLTRRLERCYLPAARRATAVSGGPSAASASATADEAKL